MTPQDLIPSILKIPVDLVWNGGIGTYFKASHESNFEVGDRANDALRIDAREMRCGVVGEGGNLGLTQRARIEYALHGGRINTDFIDNSGGVDCSDREVNIKILLNVVRRKGRLSEALRRKLLRDMTDDVASLVLQDNYRQNQSVSMMESQAADRIDEQAYLIRMLEKNGEINRKLEFLPSEDEIAERKKAGMGFTRPELALLLAYSKMIFFKNLVASDLPDDPYFEEELEHYFPALLTRQYRKYIDAHPLKREIISMHVTNSIVHRMGPTFGYRMHEETEAPSGRVARAYTIARDAFAMRPLWRAIEALDNKIPVAIQYSMSFQTSRSLKHVVRRLLQRRRAHENISATVALYRCGVTTLMENLSGLLSAPLHYRNGVKDLVRHGVPKKLAQRITGLSFMYPALDIVEVAKKTDTEATHAAKVYFMIGACLSLNWLRDQIEDLSVEGHWEAVGRGLLRETFFSLQRKLTASVLSMDNAAPPRAAVEGWLGRKKERVARVERIFKDMKTRASLDYASISVALQEVGKLVS